MKKETKTTSINIEDVSVRPRDAIQMIEGYINDFQPVMLWGPPGIGKSSLIKQIAQKQNRPFIDIRLNLMDLTDLRGIPYKNNKDEMVWAPPAFLPRDPNSNAIIVLDEITTASPSIQSTALQLVLDRRVGDYELPAGVSILAAGNRDTDKTAASRMPSALSNRFCHMTLEPNIEDLRTWWLSEGKNPNIIGFLSAFPNKMNTFDPKTNNKIYATPRSWTYVDKILNMKIANDLKMTMIAGAVGYDCMLAFKAHLKIADKLPSMDDILAGKVVSIDHSLDLSVQHALAIGLVYRVAQFYKTLNKENGISNNQWSEIAENYWSFVSNNLETEIAMMAFKLIIAEPFNVLFKFQTDNIPSLKKFIKSNVDLLTDEVA